MTMKKLIKWTLNHVPRPLLQRIAGWAVPMAGLFYRGRGAECPVCGAKYRKFLPYGYVHARANALCPKCLSLERHRLLWLYLTRETDLLKCYPRTLHIAPEVCIMRHLKPHFAGHPGQYVTADLESPLADLHFDVQQIPLADDSVDAASTARTTQTGCAPRASRPRISTTPRASPTQSGNCTPCPRITSTPSISTDPATGHGARSLARQPGVYEMSGIFSGVPCLGRNARQCGSRQ